jgi:hypothetical protein
MKKLAFTLSALCIAGAAFAQTTFGIKAGPDFSSYREKSELSKENGKIIVGISGGVYASLPIAPKFFIQPSLMYEGKGGKGANDTKVRLNYLTLPVDLLFKSKMPGGNGSWIVGAGAYIGYGLSGKISLGVNDSVSVFVFSSESNPFKKSTFGEALLKRFDAGANVQLGYEMSSGFNIGLYSELGLINILRDGYDNDKLYNTSFSIMIGYTFGKY